MSVKICNRKLATRIENNKVALNKLATERQFDMTADQSAVRAAMDRCRADIDRDTETLRQHGYNSNGRKV